jgi:hypothetical protein
MASESISQHVEPKDGCPDWAARVIHRLRLLEIKLGNITPENDWNEANVVRLYDRLGGQHDSDSQDESLVETLFQQVSQGLTDEGFDAFKIADFINGRVRGMSRLPYCSATEVAAVLKH